MGQGQHRVIIYITFVNLESPKSIPSFKISDNLVPKKNIKVLALFAHGGDLGHVTKTILPLPKDVPHKKKFDWQSGFKEDVTCV